MTHPWGGIWEYMHGETILEHNEKNCWNMSHHHDSIKQDWKKIWRYFPLHFQDNAWLPLLLRKQVNAAENLVNSLTLICDNLSFFPANKPTSGGVCPYVVLCGRNLLTLNDGLTNLLMTQSLTHSMTHPPSHSRAHASKHVSPLNVSCRPSGSDTSVRAPEQ